MKDQVVMSKANGQLVIAVPLFRHHHEEPLGNLEGYSLSLTCEKPLAYVLDCGDGSTCPILNADFCEKNLEFLGEL